MCFLENNQPQSMALGHTANGIEVYNQYGTTAVQQVTYNFQNVQIYVLDTVIGIPGPFSFGANFLGLNQLMEFLNTTGIPDLDNQHGLTVFAPSDDAFNAIQSQMPSLSPSSIFANHVRDRKGCFVVRLSHSHVCRSFSDARYIILISNPIRTRRLQVAT